MERDDFTCQECKNTEKTLHVHHKQYEKGKDPWDYLDENLITLCKDCHENYGKMNSKEISNNQQNLLDLINKSFNLNVEEMIELCDSIDFLPKNSWFSYEEFFDSLCMAFRTESARDVIYMAAMISYDLGEDYWKTIRKYVLGTYREKCKYLVQMKEEKQ